MKRILIWDLPIRLFHWLFAAGFVVAVTIPLSVGRRDPLFTYHAIAGLTIALMVLLRIVWGFLGSRHARFAAFVRSPRALVSYSRSLLKPEAPGHTSHNPATAYAALAMFAMILVLAVTGFLLGQRRESVKQLHELLAYSMIAVVSAHVLGVLLHTIRRRDNIALGMITGKKAAPPEDAIPDSRRPAAAAFLVIVVAFSFAIYNGYDYTTRALHLPLIGTTLQVGRPPRPPAGPTQGPTQGQQQAQPADARVREEPDRSGPRQSPKQP